MLEFRPSIFRQNPHWPDTEILCAARTSLAFATAYERGSVSGIYTVRPVYFGDTTASATICIYRLPVDIHRFRHRQKPTDAKQMCLSTPFGPAAAVGMALNSIDNWSSTRPLCTVWHCERWSAPSIGNELTWLCWARFLWVRRDRNIEKWIILNWPRFSSVVLNWNVPSIMICQFD